MSSPAEKRGAPHSSETEGPRLYADWRGALLAIKVERKRADVITNHCGHFVATRRASSLVRALLSLRAKQSIQPKKSCRKL